MIENIRVKEISIKLIRKPVKNVHLSVYPPYGRVRIVAPQTIRTDVVRAYAISKLAWIRNHKMSYLNQERELNPKYKKQEIHVLWGKKYLLDIQYKNIKPFIKLDHNHIKIFIHSGSTKKERKYLIHNWHKNLLHSIVPKIINKWEKRLKVKVGAYFLQKMKTKWGSANYKLCHIRINTELAKKPKDLLEYIVVHEMIHLLEPSHNEHFVTLLDVHYPQWREARERLNKFPLASEVWK